MFYNRGALFFCWRHAAFHGCVADMSKMGMLLKQ